MERDSGGEGGMTGTRLTLGLLSPGGLLSDWEWDCVRRMLDMGFVELTVLVETPEDDDADPAPFPGIPLPGAMGALPSLLRMYKRRHLDRMLRRDIDPSKRAGDPERLTGPLDWEAIRRRELDVLLDLAAVRPPRQALDVARHGVWVFRLGDPGGLWGHPPGLWEVKGLHRVTSAALERCTGDDGTRIVLREGHFATVLHSYPRTLERVLQGASRWPADVCREVRTGRPDYLERTTIVEHGHMPVLRGNVQFLGLRARQLGSMFRVLSETKAHRDMWNVGVVNAPIASFLDEGFRPDVRWLPEPAKGTYRADPFGLERDGRLHLMFEELDLRRPAGALATMVVSDGRFGPTSRVAMGDGAHLSYPCLVEHGGEVYCVPETSLREEVALYRATDFPSRWERVATLVEGVAAVDPTLFRHDGRWWLTFTDAAEGSALNLFVMHSASLASGWTPHPGNPVKTDIRSARPAGTPFSHEGELYRPAQDCSATYGGRVALNRVLKLSPTAFEEETVGYVGPFPGEPYPQGCHTLASVGDRTLLDGKMIVFGRPPPDVNP